MLCRLLLIPILVLLFTQQVNAADVTVPTSEFSASRNKPILSQAANGLTAEGLLSNLLNYTINWNVSDLGGGNYRYFYQFGNLGSLSVAESDVFLELGANTYLANLSNIKVNGGLLDTLLGVTASNSTFRGDHGITFDSTGSVLISNVQFDVKAAPIYGDFFNGSLAGNLVDVRNTGFGTTPTAGSTANFVAIAGNVAVPEPETYLLLGSFLVFAFWMVRQKRLTSLNS